MPDGMADSGKNTLFMNIKLFSSLILLAMGLTACAPPQPPQTRLDAASASLSEASYSVSRSIVNLSEVAQASHPMPDLGPAPNPMSYGMAGLTSVDWSGPVEPLVKQLAKAANYRVRVLGRAPAIPVLVTIYDKNRMLADIFRDVGYQAGRRASVVIYPEERVVELRYAKF
jgi:defect in organelle trafficking protein DotD